MKVQAEWDKTHDETRGALLSPSAFLRGAAAAGTGSFSTTLPTPTAQATRSVASLADVSAGVLRVHRHVALASTCRHVFRCRLS